MVRDTGAAPGAAERIGALGRECLRRRLREALEQEARGQGVTIGHDEVERVVADACGRASGPLWRISLAEAATSELGIPLSDAVAHPEVERAHQLVDAPPYQAGEPAAPATPPTPIAPPPPPTAPPPPPLAPP
ncbi:MAG: hypothetical protein ACYC0H_18580, partial [Solirubrobacteraceae bacterium]